MALQTLDSHLSLILSYPHEHYAYQYPCTDCRFCVCLLGAQAAFNSANFACVVLAGSLFCRTVQIHMRSLSQTRLI